MTVRNRLILPFAALALTFAIAAPAAFAEDTMGKDNMLKPADTKMNSPTGQDQMSATPSKPENSDMKKDSMKDPKPNSMSDGMKK